VVTETYDNDDHFDITYIIIVWFAFLPTVIVPWFIAHWLLIGALRKDRFLPYVNNGNGHHYPQQPPRRHSAISSSNRFEANIPSVSRPTAVNETIMVHDLGTHRAVSSRPNDHPTPGKLPKRPRTKSSTDEVIYSPIFHGYWLLWSPFSRDKSTAVPPISFLGILSNSY